LTDLLDPRRTARGRTDRARAGGDPELSAADLAAVRDLLVAHVPDVGPLRASLLAGGRSNLTRFGE
jgi:hypothetical protein